MGEKSRKTRENRAKKKKKAGNKTIVPATPLISALKPL